MDHGRDRPVIASVPGDSVTGTDTHKDAFEEILLKRASPKPSSKNANSKGLSLPEQEVLNYLRDTTAFSAAINRSTEVCLVFFKPLAIRRGSM